MKSRCCAVAPRVAAVLGWLAWLPPAARAADYGLAVSPGTWETPAHWTPAGVPGSGDRIFVGAQHPSSSVLLTGTVTVASDRVIGGIEIGHGYWNRRGTLSIDGGNITLSGGHAYVQGQGTGTVNQVAGNFTANSVAIILGNDAGSAGVWNQAGGDVTVNGSDVNIAAGTGARGEWNLAAGRTLTANVLNLGSGSGSTALFSFAGSGTVRVQYDVNVGGGAGLAPPAAGCFRQWGAYAGTNGVNRDLNVGRWGGSGAFTFPAGVFNVGNPSQSGTLRAGYYESGSRGTLNLSAGAVVNVFGSLNLGEVGSHGGWGGLNIASGGTVRVQYDVNIGRGGAVVPPPGGFKQWGAFGATNGVNRDLNIGRWGGTNSFTVPDSQFLVGNSAQGGMLRLGYYEQDSAGTLVVPSGRTVRVSNSLEVGPASGSHGAINAAPGSQIHVNYDAHFFRDSCSPPAGFFRRYSAPGEAGVGRDLYVGRGPGTNVVFTQADAEFFIGGSDRGGTLFLGNDGGSEGTYVLRSNQVLRVWDSIRIGREGLGHIQAGPGARIVTRNNHVYLDRASFTPPVPGLFCRADGVTVGVQGGLYVGDSATNRVVWTQADTNFYIGGDLSLGYNANRRGVYGVSSGQTVRVGSWLTLGYDGDGFLNAAPGAVVKAGNVRANRNSYAPPAGVFRRQSDGAGGIDGSLYLNDSSEPGTLVWTQSDAVFRVGGDLDIGYWSSSAAAYALSAGQSVRVDGWLYLGHDGLGALSAPPGSKVLGNHVSLSRRSYAPPSGIFFWRNGTTPGVEGNFYVARANDPDPVTFTQSDPAWNVGGELRIAHDGPLAVGTYALGTNRLNVASWLVVSENGCAVLEMRGGTIGGNGPVMIGNADQDLRQELRGFGRITKPGDFSNRGRVVASGGTLDIANVNNIYCDRDCVPDADDRFTWREQRGWFAQDGGKLLLKPVAVAAGNPGVSWGEQADDTAPDMVNSARLAFSGVTGAGSLAIDLLAADSAEMPTGLNRIASVWQLRRVTGLVFASCTVTLRYDDRRALENGTAAEAGLKLFRHDGASWRRVTAGVTFDAANHRVTLAGLTALAPLAVAEDYGLVDNDGGAHPVGADSATLNGTLLSTNGAVTRVWVFWGPSDGGTDRAAWTNAACFGACAPGALATNLTGLLPQQQYYYRFYASNSVADAWAPDTAAFQTLGAPVISTLAPTGVTTNRATLRAAFSSGGAGAVRIFWGTTDQGESLTAWDRAADFGTQSQGVKATNVAVRAGQRYYCRAYATNAIGEDWADTTVTFVAPAFGEAAISSTLLNPWAQYNTAPSAVFVSDALGYAFYIGNAGAGRVCYRKTVDGGVTWGGEVEVGGGSAWANLAVWYDRWTPGDEAGTGIHIAALNAGDAELWYRRLDTAGDSLSAAWVQVNSAAVPSDYWTDGYGNAFITRSTDGQLFAGYSSRFWSAVTSYRYYTTVNRSVDAGGSWSEIHTWSAHGEPRRAENKAQLLPLGGGDVLLIQQEFSGGSTLPVQSRVWHAATQTWDSRWTPIDHWRGNDSFDVMWSAVLDKHSGAVYLAGHTYVASALGSVRVYRYDESTRAWSPGSTLLDDPLGQVTQTALLLDDNTGDLYAVYARNAVAVGSDPNACSIYCRRSTDGGETWSEEGAALSASADDYRVVRGSFAGDSRLYATWIDNDDYTLYGRTVATLDPKRYRIDNAAGAGPVAAAAATLNGRLLKKGAGAATVRIAWGDHDGGTSAGSWHERAALGDRGVGAFSNTVATVPGTRYFYRCYVEDAAGGNRAWAPVTAQFGTDGAPVVDNAAATDVRGSEAVLHGTLVSDGGLASAVRIFWGDHDGGAAAGGWDFTNAVGVVAEGAFSARVGGLAPGVTHYFRCCATNAAGADWADAAMAIAPAGRVLYVNRSAAGANNGLSWADAFTSLTAALAAATATDVLWVAQGTYTAGTTSADTFALGGKAVFGGFAAGDGWAARDPAAKRTVLSGDLGGGAYAWHVVSGHGTLDGVTVRDGKANGGGANNNGGGLYLSAQPAGVLDLRNCTFTNNVAQDYGAGVFASSTRLPVSVRGCVFAGNRTSESGGGYGGGIFLEDLGQEVVVADSVFCDNVARYRGAAIFARSEMGRFRFDGVRALRNRTDSGDSNSGGPFLFLEASLRADVSTFDGCTFAGNRAAAGNGAVTFYSPHREARFTDCAFDGNYAAGNGQGGAAIHFRSLADGAEFRRCRFLNNAATPGGGYGGAIMHTGGYAWDGLRCYDCAFTSNAADRAGGALYSDRSDVFGSPFVFSNCTFLANRTAEPGYSGGALEIVDGAALFTDCSFTSNRSTAWGGAVQMEGYRTPATNPVRFVRCGFAGNRAGAGNGGAVAVRAGDSGASKVLAFTNCTFSGNATAGGDGGALWVEEAKALAMADCVFEDNRAPLTGNPGGHVRVGDCDDGITFRRCRFARGSAVDGGAVYIDCQDGARRAFVMEGCEFYANSVWNAGGALRLQDVAGTITNCTFDGNATTNTEGGAVYYYMPDAAGVGMTFADCRFRGNRAAGNGGALRLPGGSDIRVFGCTFAGNRALGASQSGGAIYKDGTAKRLSIHDSAFATNTAALDGGALYSDTQLLLSNCVFTANAAGRRGGAVWRANSSLTAIGCDFVTNTTASADGYAGGGAVGLDGAYDATLRNCLFARNRSATPDGRSGGALRVDIGNNGLTLVNCTFTANSAAFQGGAIRVGSGHASVTNCIFWADVCAGPTASDEIYMPQGYRLRLDYSILDTAQVYDEGASALGAHVVNADPLFAAAAAGDYHLKSITGRWGGGGWTRDSEHSPAIDAGDPAAAWAREPAPNGARVNLGRYGNTAEASQSLIALIDNDGGATGITPASARLRARLIQTNSAGVHLYLYWGTHDGGTVKSAWSRPPINAGAVPVGTFTNLVTGLASNTLHYYRCYASNAVGDVWAAATAAFRTTGSAPKVINLPATAVLTNGATLNGRLTAGGQGEVFIYWGLTDGGVSAVQWQHVVTVGTEAEGDFAAILTGLASRTKYYYRCYVTNAAGEDWADQTAFFATGPGSTLPPGATVFQEGWAGYAGTEDSSLPAGAGQGVWTPGYYGDLWVGEDYFAAGVDYGHDEIPPHEADDWRPRRSIVRFKLNPGDILLGPSRRIRRAELRLTRVDGSGTYTHTPLRLYLLPAADGGWREGVTDWGDTGAACWDWRALDQARWSDELPVLVASATMNSSDPAGTVYTFSIEDASFIEDWLAHDAANAGFRIVAPAIEYGLPGYQGVSIASSEHANITYRPLLCVWVEVRNGAVLWIR